MSTPSPCARASFGKLIEYWLGELDGAEESHLEEHLFRCAECSARLRQLAQLSGGIRRIVREGQLFSILTPSFLKRLESSGVRVRAYSMNPGGSVLCTVRPDDERVVAHLHAPLADVRRLDLVLHDETEGFSLRLEDLAFEASANEVVLSPNMAELRRLTYATQRVQLIAVEGTDERLLGQYTFNHSPYQVLGD